MSGFENLVQIAKSRSLISRFIVMDYILQLCRSASVSQAPFFAKLNTSRLVLETIIDDGEVVTQVKRNLI